MAFAAPRLNNVRLAAAATPTSNLRTVMVCGLGELLTSGAGSPRVTLTVLNCR